MAVIKLYKRCKGYMCMKVSKGAQNVAKQRFERITKENTCGAQEVIMAKL